MDLEIIINPKDTEDGKAVIQVRSPYVDSCTRANARDWLARDRCRCRH